MRQQLSSHARAGSGHRFHCRARVSAALTMGTAAAASAGADQNQGAQPQRCWVERLHPAATGRNRGSRQWDGHVWRLALPGSLRCRQASHCERMCRRFLCQRECGISASLRLRNLQLHVARDQRQPGPPTARHMEKSSAGSSPRKTTTCPAFVGRSCAVDRPWKCRARHLWVPAGASGGRFNLSPPC